MSKSVLCFDLGASSGRAMLAELNEKKIKLTEVHRFKNRGVPVNGTLYWDILSLYNEIKIGLVNAEKAGGFMSVGIDTWGVDYGIIDKKGFLIGNPIQYRDKRTNGMLDEADKLIGLKKLYSLTGNQLMDINTAFQLLSDKINRPYVLENGAVFLLIADLLGYMLTGIISTEMSAASTTQLFNPNKLEWSLDVAQALGIPAHLFPKIINSGEIKGELSKNLCCELNIPTAKLISVCGHDTQCAAFATPANEKDFVFLSCGTWSLLGTILDRPLINEKTAQFNITNELGYGGKTTFLKNITGLWLVQETKAFLEANGENITFADLEAQARAADYFTAFIDTDAEEFFVSGDIPLRVRESCIKTGQAVPQTLGEVMRTIYLSLAMKYRSAFEQISECTGKKYCNIYMLGGGTKDRLLCSLTSDVCGVNVIAGPIEATVIGNAAIQFRSCGAVENESMISDITRNSEELKTFVPQRNYDNEYFEFKRMFQ